MNQVRAVNKELGSPVDRYVVMARRSILWYGGVEFTDLAAVLEQLVEY